jgi:hypothetical protein
MDDDLNFITNEETKQVAGAMLTWAAEINGKLKKLEAAAKRDRKTIKTLEDRLNAIASNQRRGVLQ